MDTPPGKSALPNLTPGMAAETMAQLIPNSAFDVMISSEGHRFTALAKNVVAWNHHVDYDDDEDSSTQYHTLTLTVNLTVESLNEIPDLLPEDLEEAPDATVTITYRGKDGTPLFRHSFTGEPFGQSPTGGSLQDTSPAQFTLIFECTKIALTQRL